MAEISTLTEALTAVKANGWELQNVPERFKTAKICLEAVKNNGWALEFVPNKLRTERVCCEARKNSYSHYHLPYYIYPKPILAYIPDELKTEELCLEAVKHDERALEYVPEKLKTAELCLEAVKVVDGMVFKRVLMNPKTTKVRRETIKESYRLLSLLYPKTPLAFVPEELKTTELCLEAVKHNVRALEHVPSKLKTRELCLEAVKKDNYAFALVPSRLKAQIKAALKNK